MKLYISKGLEMIKLTLNNLALDLIVYISRISGHYMPLILSNVATEAGVILRMTLKFISAQHAIAKLGKKKLDLSKYISSQLEGSCQPTLS